VDIQSTKRSRVLTITPGGGRSYQMAGALAIYLADGEETSDSYSISEWWLDARQSGPAPHSHDVNDDIFYVLDGTMTFYIQGQTIEAPKGAFIRIPAGVVHGIGNNSDSRAGVLNIFIPGGFEKEMRHHGPL
jgi:quercetin dioxygenase-like cupin family protein